MIGLAVVGMVAILGAGILMQLVHRVEGWPLGQFAGLSGTLALALNVLLAGAALAVGTTYSWRGIRHWRGDLAGGRVSAVLHGAMGAGAFFSAIELITAIS
jgi:hypothetical protein